MQAAGMSKSFKMDIPNSKMIEQGVLRDILLKQGIEAASHAKPNKQADESSQEL